jgi:uncharacterized protein YjbJ (UPF0337 family)
MNKDQVTGKVERVAGRVKQGVGEAIGNQKMANQGVADQVKGAARETWGDVKDAAAATSDRRRREEERKANTGRADVSDKVKAIRDKAHEKIEAHKTDERKRSKTA